jgi:aspartate oxidase
MIRASESYDGANVLGSGSAHSYRRAVRTACSTGRFWATTLAASSRSEVRLREDDAASQYATVPDPPDLPIPISAS